MKTKILKKLRETDGYVSGQELCSTFGVSRTAVWKAVNSLKQEGFQIEAVQNKGYHLVENDEQPDVLSKAEIESRLTTEWAGRKIYFYPEIDSTNTELKRIAEKDDSILHGALAVTDHQIQGRGRRGRSWDSTKGKNIAMTLLMKPSFAPDQASMLTLVMAMAVAAGIDEVLAKDSTDSLPSSQIKWPNDILVNGRKICGILTEMSSEPDFIHYVVIGVGINVNSEEFPKEICETASSLFLQAGHKVNRAQLIASIMKHFEYYESKFEETGDLSLLTEEYNKKLVSNGRTVRVLDPAGEFEGIAEGISNTGELSVKKEDGTVAEVYAGEVSVRGIYGYV